MFLGQDFPRPKMRIDKGEYFQALALGKHPRNVPPEILAHCVEILAWMQRDVGFHLEVVPIVGVVF